MIKLKKKGRKVSAKVTAEKSKLFIDDMLTFNNCAIFEREINNIVVRAVFNVHRATDNKSRPIYVLHYSDDNNASKIVIPVRVYRSSELHHVIQDFQRSIYDYLCVLSK